MNFGFKQKKDIASFSAGQQDPVGLLCRFDLLQSTLKLDKLPKRLLQVLQQDRNGGGIYDACALLKTVKSIRKQYFLRMWLAALPCSILYTVLFMTMCAGLVASIAAIWNSVSQRPMYLLIPTGILLALIVLALLFVTIVPLIFVNPMQRLALRSLHKYITHNLNKNAQYSALPIEFRVLVCATDLQNTVISHREEQRLDPNLAGRQIRSISKRSPFSCFLCFSLGSCNNTSNVGGEGGIMLCVLFFIAMLLLSFICVCSGVSLFDLIIDRAGIPSGLWLEVWLKPTSGIALPPDECIEASDFPNGQHFIPWNGHVAVQETSYYPPDYVTGPTVQYHGASNSPPYMNHEQSQKLDHHHQSMQQQQQQEYQPPSLWISSKEPEFSATSG